MKYLNKILCGDCLEVMKQMPDNSIDSVVTDPPYGLVSIIKRFGGENSRNTPAMGTKDGGVFARKAAGFMGKQWDGSGIEYSIEMWQEVLRVLKPGGHLLSFGGTRTYHRMACAIEDAGFEIRDMINWIYGSGFPKSRNIGKDIEKHKVGGIKNLKVIGSKQGIKCETGTQGYSYSKEYVAGKCMGGSQISGQIPIYEINNEWDGYGTALKPAHEPIVLARKPLSEPTVAANVLKWGTGGINIDECRVGFDVEKEPDTGDSYYLKRDKPYPNKGSSKIMGMKSDRVDITMNKGRFPANLIHDGSDEVMALFPNTNKQAICKSDNKSGWQTELVGGKIKAPVERKLYLDENNGGSSSRFFYCAKSSKSERNMGCEGLEDKAITDAKGNGLGRVCDICGASQLKPCGCENNSWILPIKNKNNHPTVKPIKLMEYLVKLITPPNGIVLDPFGGSGSTGCACIRQGRPFILIEKQPEYVEIARKRLLYTEKPLF